MTESADAHADPNATRCDGMTPLLLACKEGLHGVVCGLLAAGANPNNLSPSFRHPLAYACMIDRPLCAQALLHAQADVDQLSHLGIIESHIRG